MSEQDQLFEAPPAWAEHWEGMPEFNQADERPHSSLNVYFASEEDRQKFLDVIGCPTPDRKRGVWFPFRPLPRDSFDRDFEPDKVLPNKYPIYVISKGRWDPGSWRTYRALDKLGIDYHIVVEPQERDRYAENISDNKILVLPFSNLGQGSIPARNWVWDHAVKAGAERHWILDDNIADFARLNNNKIRIIKDENPFIPCEQFVDRYRNVGLAGLQYRGFADSAHPDLAPYRLNTRIYSCILINHAIPHRWRGRYNEDTDLSLRALKDGWVTVLFNNYQIHKAQTMTVGGGNTDELYAGDGRLKMAESLRDQHPDCVTITEKWGRYQHHVDYSPFKWNKLVPKSQLDLLEEAQPSRSQDDQARNERSGSGMGSGDEAVRSGESSTLDSGSRPVALGDEEVFGERKSAADGGGTGRRTGAEATVHSGESASANGGAMPLAGMQSASGPSDRSAAVGADAEGAEDDGLLAPLSAGRTEDSEVDQRTGLEARRYGQEEGAEVIRRYLADRQPAVDRFVNEVVATCVSCKKPVCRNQPRKVVGRSIVGGSDQEWKREYAGGDLVHLECS